MRFGPTRRKGAMSVPDLVETLAAEGGKDLVQALVAGLVHLAGKIPALWRHAGRDAEKQMAEELELAAAKLSATGPDHDYAVMKSQLEWETRLRDLLRRYPQVKPELEDVLSELRQGLPAAVRQSQNIIGNNAPAYGVMNGNIINHYHDGGRRLPDPPQEGAEPDKLP